MILSLVPITLRDAECAMDCAAGGMRVADYSVNGAGGWHCSCEAPGASRPDGGQP